jgi:hypothetical protein
MSWYLEMLEENFQVYYGSLNEGELANIAKLLMPNLPDEIHGWPIEIIKIILGEYKNRSEPTIYNRRQIAEANLLCSNEEQVNGIFRLRKSLGSNFSIKPGYLEHQPEWIVEVVDLTLGKNFQFCTEHPSHKIIWQAPARGRK